MQLRFAFFTVLWYNAEYKEEYSLRSWGAILRGEKAVAAATVRALFFSTERRQTAKELVEWQGNMAEGYGGIRMENTKNQAIIVFSKEHFCICLDYVPKNSEMHFLSLNDSSVYQLKNRRSGYVYVGKASYFISRIKRHYWQLIKGSHFCKEIQKDFDNGDEFIASPVDGFSGFEDEQFIIHCFLNANIPLYNVCVAKER